MTAATALHQPIAGANESRDRRAYPRFRISLPLSMQHHTPERDSRELSGETVNMSGRGLYLVTDRTLECGTTLSVILTLTHEHASPPVVMRARTRVVRSEMTWHQGLRRVGVAAEIEYFSV
jgi:c-di-GMP-binding flagellar brake protein YcgR